MFCQVEVFGCTYYLVRLRYSLVALNVTVFLQTCIEYFGHRGR